MDGDVSAIQFKEGQCEKWSVNILLTQQRHLSYVVDFFSLQVQSESNVADFLCVITPLWSLLLLLNKIFSSPQFRADYLSYWPNPYRYHGWQLNDSTENPSTFNLKRTNTVCNFPLIELINDTKSNVMKTQTNAGQFGDLIVIALWFLKKMTYK